MPIPALQRGLQTFGERLCRFSDARGGVAAVEFALILPIMIAMLLGMTEFSVGYAVHRKLTGLSRSLADLTARATQMTSSDMQTVFAAASATLQPYDSTPASMVVSSILVTLGAGNTPIGTVAWSCAKIGGAGGLAKRKVGSLYPVPSGFENSGSFILSETTYKYVPAIGSSITPAGGYTLSQTTPWPVRNSTAVTWQGSKC